MTQICTKCKLTRSVNDFYKSKSNISGFEWICKDCKRIQAAARRYHITWDAVKKLYSHNYCMCCGVKFNQRREIHIHHIGNIVRGVVCGSCNRILGQETQYDLNQIKVCLDWIEQDRENLFDKVNQQERLKVTNTRSTCRFKNPQRLARYETHGSMEQICKQCRRVLPLTAFRLEAGRYHKTCIHCQVCLNSAATYKLPYKRVYELYTQKVCDCCQTQFTKKNKYCIHHTNNQIFGLVCNQCNRLLGNESGQRKKQLLACVNWIEEFMIQSELCGNVKSLAEMTRPTV